VPVVEGVPEFVNVAVAVIEGVAEGVPEPVPDAVAVGLGEPVSLPVAVGDAVGVSVGVLVGVAVIDAVPCGRLAGVGRLRKGRAFLREMRAGDEAHARWATQSASAAAAAQNV
jgi:hypothetical protein